MSFFELPPPPEPEEQQRQPAWLGPPENEAGVVVPLNVSLARADEVAVFLLSATAFSTGIELAGTVRTREQLEALHEAFVLHRRRRSAELEPELFRFGVEFADGRKATNLGHPFQRAQQDEDPSQPVLIPRGGGGGGRSWQMNWWIWPLPPPGPLALVCEWPAQGIELTRHELDATQLLEAARRVEPLWPDGDPSGGSGWSGSTVQFFSSQAPRSDQPPPESPARAD
jgi:hypothetical protein